MGTIILWTIGAIIFIANPLLFTIGIIIYALYKMYSLPDNFSPDRPKPSGSDHKKEEQKQENTRGKPPEVIHVAETGDIEEEERLQTDDEILKEIQEHILRNRAIADEEMRQEREREYAERERKKELGIIT